MTELLACAAAVGWALAWWRGVQLDRARMIAKAALRVLSEPMGEAE